jgi:hypothetical protein
MGQKMCPAAKGIMWGKARPQVLALEYKQLKSYTNILALLEYCGPGPSRLLSYTILDNWR